MKHYILEKARSHKYIRRTGAPLHYQYVYEMRYDPIDLKRVQDDLSTGKITRREARDALMGLGYGVGAANRVVKKFAEEAGEKPKTPVKVEAKPKTEVKPKIKNLEEQLKWAHRKIHHDVGETIGGARKEIAYDKVNANNINQLEKEGIKLAWDKVTKDAVFATLDWDTEKAMGVSAGAAYFKKQLIGAVASRPPDSPQMREAYVHGEQYLMDSLAHCKSVGDVKDFIVEFSQLTKKKKLDRIVPKEEFEALMSQPGKAGLYYELAYVKLYGKPMPGIIAEQTADRKSYKIFLPSNEVTGFDDYVKSFGPRFENIVQDYLIGFGWARRGRVSSFWKKDASLARHYEQNDDWSWSGKKVAGERKKRFEWERAVDKDVNRVGGQDAPKTVSAATIKKNFNLRGIEYGNWINDDDAAYHIKSAWTALSDLADILGVEPNDVSLNGRLALAIGARGSGKAAAHYEPLRKVVNLTKFSGGGCLAHEWGHAFDNVMAEASLQNPAGKHYYFSQAVNENEIKPEAKDVKYAFDHVMSVMMKGDPAKQKADLNAIRTKINNEMRVKYYAEKDPVAKDKIRNEWNALVKEYRRKAKRSDTTYYATAQVLGEYWKRPQELFARAFESYVEDKLDNSQRKNTYLVTGTKVPYAIKLEGMADELEPYPRGDERVKIDEAMDQLMDTIRKSAAMKKALVSLFNTTMKHFIIEKAKPEGYFYIDFDQTLSRHKTGWGIERMGEPVPKMFNKVKELLDRGENIKIFTARASYPGQKKKVQDWLEDHGLPRLPVTNIKGDDVIQIFDDKARQVVPNKGIVK